MDTTCIEAARIYDGDIAGKGVRVSFYIQNLILVLLINRSNEDTENALWTFVATSFGLVVAALVQVGGGVLTFLEGILVSQLAWFANLGTFLALASYSRSKGQDSVVKIAAVFQGYLAMVLTIVMWSMADKMQYSDCRPPIKFVFMFAVPLPAFGTGREIALVFASLALVVFTGLTYTEVKAWLGGGRSREAVTDIEMVAPPKPKRQKLDHHEHHSHHKPGHQGRSNNGRFRQRWLPADVGPVFFGILLSQLVIFIYFVVTTELIIWKNGATSPDSSTWGFGQVLAMTVVIPSVIALVRAILKKAKLQPEDSVGPRRPRLRSGSRNDPVDTEGHGNTIPSSRRVPSSRDWAFSRSSGSETPHSPS